MWFVELLTLQNPTTETRATLKSPRYYCANVGSFFRLAALRRKIRGTNYTERLFFACVPHILAEFVFITNLSCRPFSNRAISSFPCTFWHLRQAGAFPCFLHNYNWPFSLLLCSSRRGKTRSAISIAATYTVNQQKNKTSYSC